MKEDTEAQGSWVTRPSSHNWLTGRAGFWAQVTWPPQHHGILTSMTALHFTVSRNYQLRHFCWYNNYDHGNHVVGAYCLPGIVLRMYSFSWSFCQCYSVGTISHILLARKLRLTQRNGRAGIWTQARLIPALGYLPPPCPQRSNFLVFLWLCFCLWGWTTYCFYSVHLVLYISWERQSERLWRNTKNECRCLYLQPSTAPIRGNPDFLPYSTKSSGLYSRKDFKMDGQQKDAPAHTKWGIFSLTSGMASSSRICLKSPL